MIKFISVFITSIFLWQQILWAAGDVSSIGETVSVSGESSRLEADLKNIHVPHNLARIDEIDLDAAKDVIINIQDCHSSLSAQYSIVSILKRLLQDYDISVVAIEGASGYVDTSILRSFPDKKIREKTAAYLMEKSKISAGEFFSVITDDNVALYGVESNLLYQENLQMFKDIYAGNRGNIKVLDIVMNRLRQKEKEIYKPPLSHMAYKSRLYRYSKISFDVYWEFMKEMCNSLGMSADKYPNIKSFTDCILLEKEIDFIKTTSQRKELVNRLAGACTREELKEMIIKTLSFEKGETGQSEYHEWLLDLAGRKNIRTDKYIELHKYSRYTKIYCGLDIVNFQEEIDSLEKDILAKLFTSAEERELYRLERLTGLLKLLFEIKLTGKDLSYVSAAIDKVTIDEVMKFMGSREITDTAGKCINVSEQLKHVLFQAKQCLRFYELAEKRNHAMVANTVTAMRREGKCAAALISGGHHTQGLTGILKEKGLSYLVFVPKFSDDKNRPYVAVLTKKAGPYKEILSLNGYDLALESYFDTGELKEIEEVLAFAIGQSVLQKRNFKDEIKEWSKLYKKAYLELSESRRRAMDFSPIKPNEFKWHLAKIKLESVDNGRCRIRIGKTVYDVSSGDMRIERLDKDKVLYKRTAGEHVRLFFDAVSERYELLKQSHRMEKVPLKIAFFDWDGTIEDSMAFILEAFAAVYNQALGGTREEALSVYKEIDGMTEQGQYNFLGKVAEKKGIKLKWNVSEWLSHFLLAEEQLRGDKKKEVKSAVDFLKYLRNTCGVSLHITSGTRFDKLKDMIKEYGLSDVVEGIYGSPSNAEQKAGFAKDKGEYMKKVLEDKSLSPENAVMFGDTKIDGKNAKKAGVLFVGRAENKKKKKELLSAGAAFTIKDYTKMSEIKESVEQELAQREVRITLLRSVSRMFNSVPSPENISSNLLTLLTVGSAEGLINMMGGLAFTWAVKFAEKKRKNLKNIMYMRDEEILNLSNPEYAEIRKHSLADWNYAKIIAKEIGINEDSEEWNMLRVICLAHDIGGILGDSHDEDIECRLIAAVKEKGIKYINKDPEQVMAEFENAGIKLSREEERIVAALDDGNNSIRVMDRHHIRMPKEVRDIISHMQVPSEEELKSWSDRKRRLYTCYKIADDYEHANNYYKRKGGYWKKLGDFEEPKATLGFLRNKEFKGRDSVKGIIDVAEKIALSGGFDEAIKFSRTPELSKSKPVMREIFEAPLDEGTVNADTVITIDESTPLGFLESLVEIRYKEIEKSKKADGKSVFSEKYIKSDRIIKKSIIRLPEIPKLNIAKRLKIVIALTPWRKIYRMKALLNHEVNTPHPDEPCVFCNLPPEEVLFNVIINGRQYVVAINFNPVGDKHIMLISKAPLAQDLSGEIEDTALFVKALGPAYETFFNSPGSAASKLHFHAQILKGRFSLHDNIQEGLVQRANSSEINGVRESMLKGWLCETKELVTKSAFSLSEEGRKDIDLLKQKNVPYTSLLSVDENGVLTMFTMPVWEVLCHGIEELDESGSIFMGANDRGGYLITHDAKAVKWVEEHPVQLAEILYNSSRRGILSVPQDPPEDTRQAEQSFRVEVETDERILERSPELIKRARKNAEEEILFKDGKKRHPLGVAAELIDDSGKVIAQGTHRMPSKLSDVTPKKNDHAVIVAFEKAEEKGKTDWSNYTLVLSLEPADVPAQAIINRKVKKVVIVTLDFGSTMRIGDGVRALRWAGIDVTIAPLKYQREALEHLCKGEEEKRRVIKTNSAFLSLRRPFSDIRELKDAIRKRLENQNVNTHRDKFDLYEFQRDVQELVSMISSDKESAIPQICAINANSLDVGLAKEKMMADRIPLNHILWARQAAYLKEESDFRVIIAGSIGNCLKVIDDIKKEKFPLTYVYILKGLREDETPQLIPASQFIEHGSSETEIARESLLSWIDAMRQSSKEERQRIILDITFHLKIAPSYKKVCPEMIQLLKHYSKNILDILFDEIKEEIESHEEGYKEDKYWNARFVNDFINKPAHVIQCIFRHAKAAEEKDLVKDIMTRVSKLPFPYSGDKTLLAQLAMFYTDVIAPCYNDNLYFYLLAFLAVYGNTRREINEGIFSMMYFLHRADNPEYYYLTRKLGSFYFRDHSGQVGTGPDNPLRQRTRAGQYEVDIDGVIREAIHNNLAVYALGLLERMLEYYHTGNLNVLADESYKPDVFGKDEFPAEDAVFPNSVLERRRDYKVLESDYHWIITKLFEHLEGEFGKKVGVKGETKYEKLINISDENLQKIYDAINEELGTKLAINKNTVDFTGYIYAYRELAKRYKRDLTAEKIIEGLKGLCTIYPELSRIFTGGTAWDFDKLFTGVIMESDPFEALEEISEIKKKIKDKIFSGSLYYNPEEVRERFDEDWGRDDTGNAYGGSWVRDDMLGLYMGEYVLTLLENFFIKDADAEFNVINESNIAAALEYLRLLAGLSYTEGLLPRNFADNADKMVSELRLSVSELLAIIEVMEKECAGVEDYFRQNMKDYVKRIVTAKGVSAGEDELEKQFLSMVKQDKVFSAVSNLVPRIASFFKTCDKKLNFEDLISRTEKEDFIEQNMFKLIAVLPSKVYDKISENAMAELQRITGISEVIRIDSSMERQTMMEELALRTKSTRNICIIIEEGIIEGDLTEEVLVNELKDVLMNFSEKAPWDIMRLANPEIAGLTENDIMCINNLTKLKGIMDVLVRISRDSRSYRLSEKTARQMKIESAFRAFDIQKGEADKRVEFISDITGRSNRHYLVHFADGEEILSRKGPAVIPPGLEIQKRRRRQNVTKLIDPNYDKFFIVSPENIVTEEEKQAFKREIMDLWMLEGIIPEEDIVILDRTDTPYQTSKLYLKLDNSSQGATKTNTGFRCINGFLDYDKDAADLGLLQVNIAPEASSTVNQYEVLVNLLLSRESGNMGYTAAGLQNIKRSGLYFYLPQIHPFDLEETVRRYYDRYMHEVLVKA